MNSLQDRIRRLYGEAAAPRCIDRLAMLVGRYGIGIESRRGNTWSQKDTLLIAYGDMLARAGEHPLATLKRFADTHLAGAVSAIHILPFFPFSSDDGFSVVHYRNVNPDLGTWQDIRALGDHFDLMFDLVLNHCSRASGWFQDYVLGIAPARRYFIEMDPRADLSAVVRPRDLPLLSRVNTHAGERHVWTTFSEDQVDLDFSNPDVLFESLDLLLFYIAMGARFIRLDAIAYLWKKPGTTCIHLPETHEVVKLFREFLGCVAPDVMLITETNVPQTENLSYFGQGDEAHIIYQFALPPLLAHALLAEDATHLTRWATELALPPAGCTYLNFTASHDGIGVRPLEGILSPGQIEDLIEHVKHRGGLVSTRSRPDGTTSPYELNITYFDMLGKENDPPGIHVARFLCSQCAMLSLQGIPAVYFNSLVGGRNDTPGVELTRRPRTINRQRWKSDDLAATLAATSSEPSMVFRRYLDILKVRSGQPAFHPAGPQRIHDLGSGVFAVERTSPDGTGRILCLHNLTGRDQQLAVGDRLTTLHEAAKWTNVLNGETFRGDIASLSLAPFQARWLSNQK